ncbi:O-methyltransferase MdmC [Leucoagaricus sp. SymC.cos]|nr:O-methyltransferase MdmC [Leucoagaricus sp. SymC.cos]
MAGAPWEFKESSLAEWTRSDDYFNGFLVPGDATLDAAVERGDQHGLPNIAVSPAQGKFLHLLLRSIGAKRVLELGTLGGYSAIWLARALPDDGEVVTLELIEKHAKVAAENIETVGLTPKIKILVGRALDLLSAIEPSPPFDFVFVDADKVSCLEYFNHAKRLVRPGGVIVVDNVVRQGRVSDTEYTDANVEGVRRLLEAVKKDAEVDTTVVQTVGVKGYDGFLYAFRK